MILTYLLCSWISFFNSFPRRAQRLLCSLNSSMFENVVFNSWRTVWMVINLGSFFSSELCKCYTVLSVIEKSGTSWFPAPQSSPLSVDGLFSCEGVREAFSTYIICNLQVQLLSQLAKIFLLFYLWICSFFCFVHDFRDSTIPKFLTNVSSASPLFHLHIL